MKKTPHILVPIPWHVASGIRKDKMWIEAHKNTLYSVPIPWHVTSDTGVVQSIGVPKASPVGLAFRSDTIDM